MCLMENIGDYEFEQNLEGVWGDADAEFWKSQAATCRGPQRPEDGLMGGLCQLVGPRFGFDKLFQVATGEVNISDIDGDGILDFYALKLIQRWGIDKWDFTMDLNIIYGE